MIPIYAVFRVADEFQLMLAARGEISTDYVPWAEGEAIIAPLATVVYIPEEMARVIQLNVTEKVRVQTALGRQLRDRGTVMIELCGRSTEIPCVVLPSKAQPVIGRVVLDLLDLQIDPHTNQLVGIHDLEHVVYQV